MHFSYFQGEKGAMGLPGDPGPPGDKVSFYFNSLLTLMICNLFIFVCLTCLFDTLIIFFYTRVEMDHQVPLDHLDLKVTK